MHIPKASERMAFVNVTPGGPASYARVGQGFDSATPASNTQTQTHQWIDEENASTVITGKSIQRKLSGRRVVGDAFNDYFCGLFGKTGSECETSIVVADAWAEVSGQTSVYEAKKYNVVIDCENDGGGRAGDGLPISGTIYFNGDSAAGTFDFSSKVFTAAP